MRKRPVAQHKLTPSAVQHSRALKRQLAVRQLMKMKAAKQKTELDRTLQYLQESANMINEAMKRAPKDMVLQLEGQDTAGDTR